MTTFTPGAARPPGLVPAAPRVIYKTKRDNITHEGRIGRIDRPETLQLFKAFSHRFNEHRPRLSPDLGGYLHNHGFLPDKAALYGLPNSDVDIYLSDFQVSVLPMANGRYASALSNRLLFWRLYGSVLPLAPLAGSVQSGHTLEHLEVTENQDLLARPIQTSEGSVTGENNDLSTPLGAPQKDKVFLRLPAGAAAQAETDGITRMVVFYDPGDRLPFVAGAIQLFAPLDGLDAPNETVVSRRIRLDSGELGPAATFTRGAVEAPSRSDGAAAAVPGWSAIEDAVLSGLRRLPVFAVIQFDIVAGPDGPVIIDAVDRIDAASFQVHGPLMASAQAIRFIREFGV